LVISLGNEQKLLGKEHNSYTKSNVHNQS